MYGRYETDKRAVILDLNPHYSDTRFNRAQTVFLLPGHRIVERYGDETVEGLEYVYDDRLMGWYGYSTYQAAWDKAGEEFAERRSAAFLEKYMQILLDDSELKLVHILAGINLSNGYSYRVYGYKPGKKVQDSSQATK